LFLCGVDFDSTSFVKSCSVSFTTVQVVRTFQHGVLFRIAEYFVLLTQSDSIGDSEGTSYARCRWLAMWRHRGLQGRRTLDHAKAAAVTKCASLLPGSHISPLVQHSMSVSPCRFEYTLNKGFVSQRLGKTTANIIFLKLCYRLSCLCYHKAHIN